MSNILKASDLRNREIVNITDGRRLGHVIDFEINIISGQICALFVPGPSKWFQVINPAPDHRIPWQCIKRIGDDVILVELDSGFFIKYDA